MTARMVAQLVYQSMLGPAAASLSAQVADAVTGTSRPDPYPVFHGPVVNPWDWASNPPYQAPGSTGGGATIT